MFSEDLTLIAVAFMAALAIGGVGYVVLYPLLSGEARANKRMARVSGKVSARGKLSTARTQEQEGKDQRRKQMQATLKELEEKQKKQKKRVTLKMAIAQAGLPISVRMFWVLSIVCGLVVGFLVLLSGTSPLIALLAAFAGAIGLPRWFLKFCKKRRQKKFLDEFANAIDVIVRGIKAGLPVTDTLKVISQESPEPVGPEFREIVEGQKVGVPLDQGLERMFERMPLPEVNFLAIVVAIQIKTGGNLAEALANLSKVLRDRKKMQGKILAMSQEAKSSAAIIGALPPSIMTLVYLVNPTYIELLWTTDLGQIMLAGSATWMTMGVLVMRKMINFDF